MFARKRARSSAPGDVEGAVESTLSEADTIKTKPSKRLQNTLAARRSRKQKLGYQHELEDAIDAERKDKETWRTHALVLDALLTSFQTISTFSFMYLGYITLVTIEISISWFIMRNAPFHVYLTCWTCRHLRGALLYRYLSHRLLKFSVMLTRCGHFIPSRTAADLYSAYWLQ